MDIVVLATPDGDLVGWEEQFGQREGRFVLADDGSVAYRHPADHRAWPAGSLDQFRQAAEVWGRYNAATKAEQLAAVERLHAELRAAGVLEPGGLWSVLAEQAAAGLL